MSGGGFHSLGTAVSIAGAGLCAAYAVIGARRERAARRRLRTLLGVRVEQPQGIGWWTRAEALRAWGPMAAVALGAAVLIGGLAGCVVGMAAAYGVRRWQRRRTTTRSPDPQGKRQIPLCADLMAACLAAGAGPCEAAEAVGRSLTGPLGHALGRVAAELRLGGDPAECWGRFAREPGARGLARCMERASLSGVPPVEEVASLAAEYRAARGRAAAGRARRAGVLATAPLGLCFLPAFLIVGVAPVVMGLAQTILTTGSP